MLAYQKPFIEGGFVSLFGDWGGLSMKRAISDVAYTTDAVRINIHLPKEDLSFRVFK